MGWSLVELRLANPDKVQPIRCVSHLVVDVEGMKTYADFDVIEFLDGGGSYPALLGIKWANESISVNNFKKWMMMFENHDI